MNNTDTPRTDKATIQCGWDTTDPVVKKRFAQQLEIELNDAVEKFYFLFETSKQIKERNQELLDSLSLLIAASERAAKMITSTTERHYIEVAINFAKYKLK